ncbi:MAG: alpha/beta hydrolase [Dehalococcoidia bacterium]|nr:alpha/beta hydrolase [Dehalococcoidia bacterium]
MASRRVHYARTQDGVRIAWAEWGEGSPLVFRVGNGASVELAEVLPEYFDAVTKSGYRLVMYDPRGTGLSQRPVDHVDWQSLLDDAEAVLGAIHDETLALNSPAEPIAARTALALLERHPQRFTHLVLYAPYASHTEFRDSSRLGRAAPGLREMDWETRTEVVERVLRNVANPVLGERGGELIRKSVDEGTYDAYRRLMRTELTENYRRVRVPALVVAHTKGPVPVELSQGVAALIPGSTYVQISDPTWVEAVEAEVAFFGHENRRQDTSRAPSAFRTILFTDVVASTPLLTQLRDAKMREVMHDHDTLMEAAVIGHGGRVVKTIGDAFMAEFAVPSAAVEAAIEAQRAIREQFADSDVPVRIRIGINAGEPIEEDGDLHGASVVIAKRLESAADSNGILVSDVVKQMVTGKDFDFEDRGPVELKGFDEPVRAWAVRWA